MARKPKVTERHKRIAQKVIAGMPLKHAMIEEGYTPQTASKGFTSMEKRIPALHQQIIHESLKAGRQFLADKQALARGEVEELIAAVLIRNSVNGEGKKKGSTFAAKVLGQMRRYNVFEPEIAVGVSAHIEANLPPEWVERYAVKEAEERKVIEAEATQTQPEAPATE